MERMHNLLQIVCLTKYEYFHYWISNWVITDILFIISIFGNLHENIVSKSVNHVYEQ